MELLVRQEKYEKQKGKVHGDDYGDGHNSAAPMCTYGSQLSNQFGFFFWIAGRQAARKYGCVFWT
jgi:hypothetical protein